MVSQMQKIGSHISNSMETVEGLYMSQNLRMYFIAGCNWMTVWSDSDMSLSSSTS